MNTTYGGEPWLYCAYTGELIDGKAYGTGTAVLVEGCTQFCKTWVDGQLEGIAVETWENGDVCVREYEKGKMMGKSTLYRKGEAPRNGIYKGKL